MNFTITDEVLVPIWLITIPGYYIHYATYDMLPNLKATTIEQVILVVICFYALLVCRFVLKYIMENIQCECPQETFKVHHDIANVVSCKEHVP